MKEYAAAIRKRQVDVELKRETEEQLVDNKMMLDRVDRLLGKRTDIERYIAGETYRSSIRTRKLDVSESLASFDFEASLNLSLREGTEKPPTVDGSGEVESILADSEIDRLFDDLDPKAKRPATAGKTKKKGPK